MSELNLDDPHLNDLTVGEFIAVVAELNQSLKLVDALATAFQTIDVQRKNLDGKARLVEIITAERDEFHRLLNQSREEIEKLKTEISELRENLASLVGG